MRIIDWSSDVCSSDLAYFRTSISRTVLFWTAFVLTRPLGAVVGDFLDKPLQHGGLCLRRYAASAVLLALVVMLVLALPQRPARRAHCSFAGVSWPLAAQHPSRHGRTGMNTGIGWFHQALLSPLFADPTPIFPTLMLNPAV